MTMMQPSKGGSGLAQSFLSNTATQAPQPMPQIQAPQSLLPMGPMPLPQPHGPFFGAPLPPPPAPVKPDEVNMRTAPIGYSGTSYNGR